VIFASDNWAGASGRVVASVAAAAEAGGPAYGGDPITRSVERRFADLFGHEVAVFLVGSGTAANALALSAFTRPGGVVLAHKTAHIIVDEAGATSLFGGGLTILGLDGADGKLDRETVAEAIARFPPGNVHHGRPVAVSLTQVTEHGTAYSTAEIAGIAGIAHAAGLAVHMDGARFAGAVAGAGVSPAEMTWRAGVDVMSFGGTKNGCLAAEAVVFFDPGQAEGFGLSRQRAGHGFSKLWFIAAQFDAYLGDGHWLDLARYANAMAAQLAEGIRANAGRLAFAPAANELFAVLPKSLDEKLRAAGAVYHPWPVDAVAPALRPGPHEVLVRLVTSFSTTGDEVERFVALLRA
jgi:threonine aldolase